MKKTKPETPANFKPRKGLARRFVCAEFGEVDLDKITAAQAEKLIKAGYLIRQEIDL